jgi:hypothetical protein
LGLRDVTYKEKPAVRISYPDEEGQEVAIRFRVSLDGSEKFRWRSGDKPHPYGLSLLKEARRAGHVILVEGERLSHALVLRDTGFRHPWREQLARWVGELSGRY